MMPKDSRPLFIVFFIGIILCCAVAETAPKAQTLPFPSINDEKAIAGFLAKADGDARYKLYEAYFQKAIFPSYKTGIVPYFAKDLEAGPADKRTKMTTLLLSAVKRSDSVYLTDANGLQVKANIYWEDVVDCLSLVTLYEETASVYCKALPLQEHLNESFNDISLEGKRATVLLSIMPKIGNQMTEDGKRVLLSNVLSWPSLLKKNNNYDIPSLRALQKSLIPSASLFLTAIQNAEGSLQAIDMNAFTASVPDDDELTAILPGLLNFDSRLSSSNAVTTVVLRDTKIMSQVKPLLNAIRSGGNARLKALVTLLDALQGIKGKPEDLMKEAVASKDEWTSFCLYRAAIISGGQLTDDQLLSCVDPLRPSLAAAVLEDRYSNEYLARSGYQSITVTFDMKEADAQTAFNGKILTKCLAFKNPAEARVTLPVMNAMILLGKAKYITNIFMFTSSSNFSMRESAYRLLLNSADSSMVAYFLKSLTDPFDSIRALGIQGLGAVKDSRGIEPLARILNDPSESEYLRAEAAKALGKIGDRRVAEIFKNVLLLPNGKGGDDNGIRIMAARSLGAMYEKTAVIALISNIDPTIENDLNYYCMESLGKLEDPSGFKLLIPLAMKGWKVWLTGTEYNDNLYAASWALFMYAAPEAETLFNGIWEKTKTSQTDAGYMAAYYLLRNSTDASESITGEYSAYIEKNRSAFFNSETRVYEFARLLKGRWDQETLLYLSTRLGEYSSAVQTWVLSSMELQSNPDYIPALDALKDSPDPSVRNWVASNADTIAERLPAESTAESLKTASDLETLLDSWNAEEKNAAVLSWLSSARRRVTLYLAPKTVL